MNRNLLAAGVIGMTLAACGSSTFACVDDAQCLDGDVPGMCEANGYCSFEDNSCASGRRYGELGGADVAGVCVDDLPGTTSGPSTSTSSASSPSSSTTSTITTFDPSASTSTTSDTADVGETGAPNSSDTGMIASSSATTSVDCSNFEMSILDAELAGDWIVSDHVDEGPTATIPIVAMVPQGTIDFQVSLPCAGPWYTWVRFTDEGIEDSFFVQVNGEPRSPGVFDADCTVDGRGWNWGRLSYREADQAPCEVTVDPWTMDGGDGHELTFGYRESRGLARILLTQDLDFVPE